MTEFVLFVLGGFDGEGGRGFRGVSEGLTGFLGTAAGCHFFGLTTVGLLLLSLWKSQIV